MMHRSWVRYTSPEEIISWGRDAGLDIVTRERIDRALLRPRPACLPRPGVVELRAGSVGFPVDFTKEDKIVCRVDPTGFPGIDDGEAPHIPPSSGQEYEEGEEIHLALSGFRAGPA